MTTTDAQTRLLRINSALLAARTDIARNQMRLRRAQVDWIPNVEWQGGYQYTVMPTRNQVVIGAYFDVPLWNRNQGNILAISANVRGSEAQSVAVANDLLRQLAAALGHYRASRRMVANLERSVLPDARRSAHLVLERLSTRPIRTGQLLERPTHAVRNQSRLHFRSARTARPRRRRGRLAPTRTISLKRRPIPRSTHAGRSPPPRQ